MRRPAASAMLCGLVPMRAHGQIERTQSVIEADAALVHRAVVFENVGLARLPASECPQQGNREGLAAAASR